MHRSLGKSYCPSDVSKKSIAKSLAFGDKPEDLMMSLVTDGVVSRGSIQLASVSLIQQRLQFGDVEFRHLHLIAEHLGGAWQALQTRPFV